MSAREWLESSLVRALSDPARPRATTRELYALVEADARATNHALDTEVAPGHKTMQYWQLQSCKKLLQSKRFEMHRDGAARYWQLAPVVEGEAKPTRKRRAAAKGAMNKVRAFGQAAGR